MSGILHQTWRKQGLDKGTQWSHHLLASNFSVCSENRLNSFYSRERLTVKMIIIGQNKEGCFMFPSLLCIAFIQTKAVMDLHDHSTDDLWKHSDFFKLGTSRVFRTEVDVWLRVLDAPRLRSCHRDVSPCSQLHPQPWRWLLLRLCRGSRDRTRVCTRIVLLL